MINVFYVKVDEDYAVYLAKSKKDAARLNSQMFSEVSSGNSDISHKIDSSSYKPQNFKGLQDLQNKVVSLPFYIALMKSY